MLHRLKALVPAAWLTPYHYALARLADVWYGHPSRELIVIGVTGTNGKTTTAYLIAKALEAAGAKTGCTTTAILKIGEREWLNKTKMTMPGRFFLQRMLRRMVAEGCRYAVIETSSQGLIQFRHIGVAYDIAVLTNLTPEHIEAHGGFENYKRAKRLLFEHLAALPSKTLDGAPVAKTAVINADDASSDYFATTPGLPAVVWYSVDSARGLHAMSLLLEANGSSFVVDGVPVVLKLPAKYNVENAMAALAVCKVLQVDLTKASAKLAAVERVPGRFERVDAGQPWNVIVDYAPEPESLRRLYDEALSLIPRNRLIHVLGSCGGGRDVARRPILGKLAGERADIVIVTNEDPYDDDPQVIIDQVAEGARAAGKVDGESLFRIVDRRAAIFKAMEIAREGDLVVMTGKGCEPWMCLADGKKMPWNECETAKDAIRGRLAKSASI